MPTPDRALVERLTADLAADPAAAVAFVAAFGDHLARVVRRHLRSFGRHDLARDGDEVQGLVWEVTFELQHRVGAWQPGGALPWTWADRALRSALASRIGHRIAELDTELLDAASASGGLSGGRSGGADVIDLDDLARRDPRVALLLEALDAAGVSDRNRAVHLEYRLQQALGDPAPSVTVAADFGLSPANVRQIDRRVRSRLAGVVACDPRYRALRGSPWIAGGSPGAPSSDRPPRCTSDRPAA